MKYVAAILFLFCSCKVYAQSLDSNYHRAWATYFGGQGSSVIAAEVNKRNGNLIIATHQSIPPFQFDDSSYYSQYGTMSYQGITLQSSSFSFVSEFDSSGHLVKSTFLPVDILQMKVAESGAIVILGATYSSFGFLPNLWQPSLLTDSTGIILSLHSDFSPAWYSRLSLLGESAYGTDLCLDESGNIYYACFTSSQQTGTEGSFQPQSQGDSTIICKVSNAGNLVWSTFYGNSSVFSMYAKNGSLYVSGATNDINNHPPGYYQTADAWIDETTHNFFSIFNNDNGQRLFSTHLPYSGGIGMTTVNSSGAFVIIRSSSFIDGLIDSSSYQSQPDDIALLKFNPFNYAPIWCTYIGGSGEESLDIYHHYLKASEEAIYFTGLTTSDSTDLLRTPNTYHHANANPDSADLFVMKFNNNGHLVWGSFYGGTNSEEGASIAIANDSTLYLAGITYSTTGISTPGSFEDTLSFAPGQLQNMIPGSIYINRGNGFIVKFIDTTHRNSPDTTPHGPDTTHQNPDTPVVATPDSLVLYPVPNNGNFTIEGSVLAEKDVDMALFDALGRRVAQRRLLRVSRQNFVYYHKLAAGNYVVRLLSTDGQVDRSFKMVVYTQ